MNGTDLGIIIAIIVGYLGGMVATIYGFAIMLGNRIDRLETKFDHFEERMTEQIQGLREDVAVLKATR